MKPLQGSTQVEHGKKFVGIDKTTIYAIDKIVLVKSKEGMMSLQQMCGFATILLGIGGFLFAKKLFNFSSKLPGSKLMHFERWPSWIFPAWVLLMRFGGIMLIATGLLVLLKE